MLNMTAFCYIIYLKYFLFSFNNRYMQNHIIKIASNSQSKPNGFKISFVRVEKVLKKIATINATKSPKRMDIRYSYLYIMSSLY